MDPTTTIQGSLQLLPPEDQILLLCLRPRLEPQRQKLLEAALEAVLDWQRLLDKGTYHRLLGLVRHHLERIGALPHIPSQTRDHLERNVEHLRQVHDRQHQTLRTCLHLFAARGIEFSLLKGPLLQDLYPDAVARATYDLDLLVHEEDLLRLVPIIQAEGFELATRIPPRLGPREVVEYAQYFEQLRFVKPDHAELEIHFRLYNYGIPDHREEIWERIQTWKVGDLQVPSLCPEDMLLYLATHANQHAFGRILWYYDVAEFYWRWREKLDWDRLVAQARKRRLLSSFYHSLLWINQLLFPERALPELESFRPSRLKTRIFSRLWRRQQVFSLQSYIRPFDASAYYLLGSARLHEKLRYILRTLLPSPRWLGAYLDCPPSFLLNFRYLRQRWQERRDWNRITRKDELLA